MTAAIDFGTSNCAAGYLDRDRPVLIPLDGESPILPTALYVEKRPIAPQPVNEALFRDRMRREKREFVEETARELMKERRKPKEDDFDEPQPPLGDEEIARCFQDAETAWEAERPAVAQNVRKAMEDENRAAAWKRFENLSILDALKMGGERYFGTEAIRRHIDDPENGAFSPSPKSFLGAEIDERYRQFFTELSTEFLAHIRHRLEEEAGERIDRVVLGRPIRFHGTRGEKGDRQALAILSDAARRAGFSELEFLEEPLAAALHYERQLREDRTVLIVDIGGGTTDCSVVRLGPSYRGSMRQEGRVLGVAGNRIGGLDLDIALAYHALMPHFGKGDSYRHGTLPSTLYRDAVSIHDLPARQRFFSRRTTHQIDGYLNLTEEETYRKLRRLRTLQTDRLVYELHHSVEAAKIALSEAETTAVDLGFIEEGWRVPIDRKTLATSIRHTLEKMVELMREAERRAQTQADLVYITGGTARSPVVREYLATHFRETEIVVGDYFGSVGLGLVESTHRFENDQG
jgi:hypothetical chaperone protein